MALGGLHRGLKKPRSWLLAIRRRIRLSHAVVVLCALLVGVDGFSTLASAWRGYHLAFGDAAAALDRVAQAAETGTNRTLLEVDSTLNGVGRAIEERLADTTLSDPSISLLLRRSQDRSLTVRDILIVDDHGTLANAAGLPNERLRAFLWPFRLICDQRIAMCIFHTGNQIISSLLAVQ